MAQGNVADKIILQQIVRNRREVNFAFISNGHIRTYGQ